jgi:hypothetical protein
MNYQMPAEGILKHNDWGDSKVYRVTCECGSSECDHNVWVEAEDTGVTVTIYTTTRSNFWTQTRWHHIWTLLTKGYIDTQATVCLKAQGALNYAETLKLAIDDVEDFRKKNVKN